MIERFQGLPDDVHRYMLECSTREPPVLARMRQELATLPYAAIQISPEQGQFLAFLVRLIGARRCIELGTFAGYSALAIALALPPTGKLITCDIWDEGAKLGRAFWREADVESRIELRVQPALQTLDQLLAEGAEATFDFAFIDADKTNQTAYYEKILELTRPGGLIAVDNTLALGVPVIRGDDEHSVATREFNIQVHHDQRVDLSLVPIGEGVTMLRKRPSGVKS